MNSNVLTAAISAAALITAVVALALNYRGFASIDGRFASLENRIGGLENRIHSDIHSLTGKVMEMDNWLRRLEERIGPPR
jgi:hypothetical protein